MNCRTKIHYAAKKICACIVVFASFSSFDDPGGAGEDYFVKRIYAHLLIKDTPAACNEAASALRRSPESKPLHEAYIRALAVAGNEKQMMEAWRTYAELFHEEALTNHELQEAMAWGVIAQGARSPSPIIRLVSLLGAFFGDDAKGVEILQKLLSDQNISVRGAAVKLSGRMRDAALQETVLALLKNEKSWKVRLEVIKAVGSMKIEKSKPVLRAIIADEGSAAEEKAAAIESLVNLMDTVDHVEISALADSDRAGLRHLACQVVSHLGLIEEAATIAPLVHDTRAEVRAAALKTLGVLRVNRINGVPVVQLAQQKLADPDPGAAISAAWLLVIHDPEKGGRAFSPWLSHDVREVRLLAAAALAASGKYGLPAMAKSFKESADPFVRMNLALGMIGQQSEVGMACEELYRRIIQDRTRWMWDDESLYKVLSPSQVRHDGEVPNYPEAVNQLVRLELLNILAVMKYPAAQSAVKQFLTEKDAQITGMASALLLTEGDRDALELVEGLLKDPNKKVKVQAAVILALWGRGEEALDVLEKSYDAADRQMKEKILEGIGKVGSRRSIPFLIDRMGEQMQTLRIIAASALLQCLYN